jgi:hypothetical protein
VNSLFYDELRPRHRRMVVHFQRTLYAGLVALGVTLLLATARPDPGPGLVAGLGTFRRPAC